jgi:hypothetical protein
MYVHEPGHAPEAAAMRRYVVSQYDQMQKLPLDMHI